MILIAIISIISTIITIFSGVLSIIAFFRPTIPNGNRATTSSSNAPITLAVPPVMLPQSTLASPAGIPVLPPGAVTPQKAMGRHGLFSRIPHASAFFGGLAVQIADVTWFAIIVQQNNKGQYLYYSNSSLFALALISFLFAIVLYVIFVIIGVRTMARLKHWGWFFGLLLGSIGGAAIFVLPGLALIVYGLAGPRTPRVASGPA